MPFLGRTPTQLVDPEVDINGGAIDGVTIGATSASAGTFTNLTATGTLTLPDDGISGDDVNGGTISNFASTGIDDNATSTAITIASGGDVTVDGTDASTSIASPAILNLKAGDANNEYSTLRFATSADGSIAYVGAKATTTGAYPNSIGNLQFGVQNGGSTVTAMTINSSGNVGIGITVPTSQLHLSKAGGTTIKLGTSLNTSEIEARESGSANLLVLSANNSADHLVIDGGGRVGIGTTSPAGPLHIQSATNRTLILDGTFATGSFTWASVRRSGTEKFRWFINNDDSISLYSDAGSTFVQTWLTDGNVGIGTTSPSRKLFVYDSGTRSDVQLSYGAVGVGASDGVQFGIQSAGSYIWNFEATDLYFATNNARAMTISSAGNVGIGTASPTSNCKLHVRDADVQIELEGTGGSNSGFVNFDGTNLQLSTNRNMKNGIFSNTGKSNASLLLLGPSGGSTIRFYTASADNTTASERLRILSSGGITFNGDSAAANALDDYEEGFWTPVMAGATLASGYGGSTATYSSRYVKIGSAVFIELSCNWSSITSSNYIAITGLPFTPAHGIWGGDAWTNGWSTEPGDVRIWSTSAELRFYRSNGSGGVQQITQSYIGTGGNIFATYRYYTLD